ncbi:MULTISPECIES: GntR family transcriptional regulator [Streptococcus]|uniref:GntR family transcriptional regulator n=1 Tax=Streptococcus TaxID=1301 RepID=UPI001F06F1CF|nr:MULTISPECIES: winged helix-turn-helix domain-containing protein [Streptococcus]MCH1617747.1 winged helix-turn-helix domain-containing protein [Streptococcus gallolyticus]WOO58891.1 winged helix-turn-helix domain-containing protein [Streptococcus pasteurianus]
MELYLNDVYPYAQQISNYIEREIFQQKLKTGQKLFSITNLANELNVSKHTIQLAYKILRSKGLIVKKGNEFFVTEDNCCIITKMKEETEFTDIQMFT